MEKQLIFLVGFMGCGKSTLGRRLATKAGYEFIDLDKLIESNTGLSIAGYFTHFGEQSFRELERDTLQKTDFPDKAVIATGGGAPCFFDNMDWMNQNGETVYMLLNPLALADRLEYSKAERPLISRLNKSELVDFITKKLEEREPFYSKAKHVVNGINITAEKVMGELGVISEDK